MKYGNKQEIVTQSKSRRAPKVIKSRCEWSKSWKENSNHATLIVDGAWKQNKKRKDGPRVAAYGWVISHNSRTIAKRGQIVNANSAIQAEALAPLLGVNEGRNHQIKDLEIWTDSKQLIEGLQENKNTPIRNIIKDILHIAKGFDSIRVTRIEREQIEKAHCLATQVRKMSSSL